MPIVILIIAVLLIAVGINNQIPTFIGLLKGDLGFGSWALAIIFVGVLGYWKPLKPISNGFLVLIFLGIILAAQKGSAANGLFTNFSNALSSLGKGGTTTTTPSNSNILSFLNMGTL